MATIRILDPSVIAKIRAGEVVDRPAAVVKELVENALDAGSRLIAVQVAAEPQRRMRVQDDGSGLGREDALLSLRRHATSKIHRAEDLARIDTLGFRGEALASIAEVSRLTLSTRAADELSGTQVEVLGGAVLQVSGVGRAVGTTVLVEDLFFNTPARLRFLKSREAEQRLISRLVWSYALAYPEVHWRFAVEGREDTELPRTQGWLERWEVLYGRAAGEAAAPVDFEAGGIRIRGLLGAPEQARANREHQTFAVNRRIVASATLGAAVRQGYGNLIPADRYPILFIELSIDPGLVDVNVHPTKREVRFRDEARLFQLTRNAVEEAMRRYVPVGISMEDSEGTTHAASGAPGSGAAALRSTPPRAAAPSQEGLALAEALYAPVQPGAAAVRERAEGDLRESLAEPEIPIWQLHDRYLLSPIRGGLVIVDQHAAHERILYEEARAHLYGGGGTSQHLLFPRMLDLTPGEMEALLLLEPHLRRLGFDVSLIGDRQIAVRGVPASVPEEAAIESLRSLFAESDGLGEGSEPPEEQIAKTYACHAAIRSGQPLTGVERRALVDRLFATMLPHGDPHGRSTYVRVSMEELDRRFGRR
jgi:DNA mismatch repair protein MutL